MKPRRAECFTDAETAELRQLWESDVPVRQIALRMGKSHSQVRRKVYHLELPLRATPILRFDEATRLQRLADRPFRVGVRDTLSVLLSAGK